MASPPDASEIELSFYEKFFFAKELNPYPVQEQAFEHIFRNHSVLVTVPTGTGKTMMAKAAIHKALARGETAIYTTPLRALTEEKFRELSEDFGEENVGFATGDYKVRPEAKVQVVVAEILWNRIFGDRVHAPADVVVMDEGHYFNDPERGHVWEQSIIGLDPRSQLIILSATIGDADKFCQWVYLCRRIDMHLVQSLERKVPLFHEFRESYMVEVAKELFKAGDVPAIVFTFGRDLCFERARLLKSCPRFTTDEERLEIAARAHAVLLDRGLAKELLPLLLHGIGIHHAGILPRYKQLVEKLTLDRLLKFVVSTETISAGINLPAKRVIFPELRKYIQKKARLLTSAEYHQMSGRAGRPQFDTEGTAIVLAPELVVQEIRKELKDAQKNRLKFDEAKIRKTCYFRARAEAQKTNDVTWDKDDHDRIINGKPATLKSQTKITAEQILAIGLPDLTREALPGAVLPPLPPDGKATEGGEGDKPVVPVAPLIPVPVIAKPIDQHEEPLPASMNLNIVTVITNLLLSEREKYEAHRRLAQVTENLRAMGIVDEHGTQITGQVINQLRGLDGLFVYHCLMTRVIDYPLARELVEFLVDHDVIQRIINRKGEDKKREWMKNRLRERRQGGEMVSWDDVEAEYLQKFPRELSPVEVIHQEFLSRVPHPELHVAGKNKDVFARMEADNLSFMDFVERENLFSEEGSLFSYLIRVMKFARMLSEASGMGEFGVLEENVRNRLSVIDPRIVDEVAGRKDVGFTR